MPDSKATDRRLMKYGLVIVCATLLGLFSASRLLMGAGYGGYSITFSRALMLSLADWYSWAVLTPVIFWLARKFPFEKRVWIRGLAMHLTASLILSIIKMTVEYNALQAVTPDPRRMFPILQLHSSMLTYWAVLGIIYAVDYYLKYREHEIKASQLETRLAHAQLQAL